MRYEQEMLEKIMYYDREGIISTFPLYIYRTKEGVNRKALEVVNMVAAKKQKQT